MCAAAGRPRRGVSCARTYVRSAKRLASQRWLAINSLAFGQRRVGFLSAMSDNFQQTQSKASSPSSLRGALGDVQYSTNNTSYRASGKQEVFAANSGDAVDVSTSVPASAVESLNSGALDSANASSSPSQGRIDRTPGWINHADRNDVSSSSGQGPTSAQNDQPSYGSSEQPIGNSLATLKLQKTDIAWLALFRQQLISSCIV